MVLAAISSAVFGSRLFCGLPPSRSDAGCENCERSKLCEVLRLRFLRERLKDKLGVIVLRAAIKE